MTRIDLATQAGLDAEATLTTVTLAWSGGSVTGLGKLSGTSSSAFTMAGMLPGLIGVAPAASVISAMSLDAAFIPVNSDPLDFALAITVSDLANTNILVLEHQFNNGGTTTTFNTSLDESTCGAPTITGADLSITEGNVQSSAGGVFVVSYRIAVSWD